MVVRGEQAVVGGRGGRVVARGLGETGQVMGIQQGTCEYQVMYGSAESLNGTPETNITLHVN